jgi:hypothetical protein
MECAGAFFKEKKLHNDVLEPHCHFSGLSFARDREITHIHAISEEVDHTRGWQGKSW